MRELDNLFPSSHQAKIPGRWESTEPNDKARQKVVAQLKLVLLNTYIMGWYPKERRLDIAIFIVLIIKS